MKRIMHAAKTSGPIAEVSLVIINLGLLAAIVVPAIHS